MQAGVFLSRFWAWAGEVVWFISALNLLVFRSCLHFGFLNTTSHRIHCFLQPQTSSCDGWAQDCWVSTYCHVGPLKLRAKARASNVAVCLLSVALLTSVFLILSKAVCHYSIWRTRLRRAKVSTNPQIIFGSYKVTCNCMRSAEFCQHKLLHSMEPWERTSKKSYFEFEIFSRCLCVSGYPITQ